MFHCKQGNNPKNIANNKVYITNKDRPISRNTIVKWLKTLAKKCDFKNWENCINHAGRQRAISKMYNTGEKISPNACVKQ